MAITQISRIQHRRGRRVDLPSALHDAEFGWADDTRELFIGNGPLSPVGGNTQILTQISPASLPNYSYISNTGAPAITGFDHAPVNPFVPDPNFPTIRSYQEKFDDYVSVLDYGAVGDGVGDTGTDNTAALRRANYDLYDERTASTDSRKFRVLYFPAGEYVITKELFLYPNTVWVGDGPGRTIIRLVNTGGTPSVPISPPNPLPIEYCLISPFSIDGGSDHCVARTVDSLGQFDTYIGVDIGCGIADTTRPPGNFIVSGISFETNTNTFGLGAFGRADVIKLEDANNVRFENCTFKGTWGAADAKFSRAIHIGSPTLSVATFGNYTFDNCLFGNNSYGFKPTVDVTNVYVVNSKFDTVWKGAEAGSGVIDVSLFRISHSIFENVSDLGFDVDTPGAGNISTYNHYRNIASGSLYIESAVKFAAGTTGCISLGDTFDTTGVFACGDPLNRRVLNLSTTNVVMNAQDPFQIPFGFCGSIVLTGDLVIDGCIISDQASAIGGGGALLTSVPFTTAGAIFFDYIMEVGTTFRIGTLHVIHDGVSITYSETYTELGGAPAEPIALKAEIVGPDVEVKVIEPPAVTISPEFKFMTRCINL